MADVDPVLCIIYLACHVHSGSVRSKSLVDSGVCAQAWASWLIMSGEPPQAGNGAGKSRRRGQWKDCRSVARHVSTVDGDHRGPFWFHLLWIWDRVRNGRTASISKHASLV